MCLPLTAENTSYISFHKKHIRPLRGGRPRTDVRVASRDIRADAVARLGWPLTRETEDKAAARLRPRTDVRVAGRNIRADAEGGGRLRDGDASLRSVCTIFEIR